MRKINYKSLCKTLLDIAVKISHEKDIESLLKIILSECRKITFADSGSIYIIQEKDGESLLRFKLTQNDSIHLKTPEFTLPIDNNSIAGYVALTSTPIKLDDLSNIPSSIKVKSNQKLSQKTGYHIRNMLVIPMNNYQGEVVGVIQLINKKKNFSDNISDHDFCEKATIPFESVDEEIVLSLASLAAILIERSILQDEIHNLLKGFIESATLQIEARDKTTSGHSLRVAHYAVKLAEKVCASQEESFQEIYFSEDEKQELYYAALLHDIGKIGIPEFILNKQSKITKDRMDYIQLNMKYIYLYFSGLSRPLTEAEQYFTVHFQDIQDSLQKINGTGYLTDELREKLEKIASLKFQIFDQEHTLLTMEDYQNLSIQRGNLTIQEKEMMESHVVQTYKFLSQIPWSKIYKKVPRIAGDHHERLNGKGYPDGKMEKDLLFQSQIIAIVDMFDA